MIIEELLLLSHGVGNDPALVQGGGGNTSVKASADVMYIKASGTTLQAMTTERGFAVISRTGEKIDPQHPERPSMEYPMHWLLPRCVIHTHSVYVNIYNCMVGGQHWLLEQFSEVQPVYVSYATPGVQLARHLAAVVEQYIPQVIFLENHGLITVHENAQKALRLTQFVHQTTLQHLQKRLTNFQPFHLTPTAKPQQCYFPDAAVLQHSDVWAANNYIEQAIQVLGETPMGLPSSEVSYLQTMESEQYRIQLNS